MQRLHLHFRSLFGPFLSLLFGSLVETASLDVDLARSREEDWIILFTVHKT